MVMFKHPVIKSVSAYGTSSDTYRVGNAGPVLENEGGDIGITDGDGAYKDITISSIEFDTTYFDPTTRKIEHDTNVARYGLQTNGSFKCQGVYDYNSGDNILDEYVWYVEALESGQSIPQYTAGVNQLRNSDFPTDDTLWETESYTDAITDVITSIIESAGNYGENVRRISCTHTKDETPYAYNGYIQHLIDFETPGPYVMSGGGDLSVRLVSAPMQDGLTFEVRGPPYGLQSENCYVDLSNWTLNDWIGVVWDAVLPYDGNNIDSAAFALIIPATFDTGTYTFDIASPNCLTEADRDWVPMPTIIPGVVVDSTTSTVTIQLDNPSPRREYINSLTLNVNEFNCFIELDKSESEFIELSSQSLYINQTIDGIVDNNSTVGAGGFSTSSLLTYKDASITVNGMSLIAYDETFEEVLEELDATSAGITLTDTEGTYTFYNEKNLDITMFPTIDTGSAAPNYTPTKPGDIFVDTTAKVSYVACGTSSSSDWKQITN